MIPLKIYKGLWDAIAEKVGTFNNVFCVSDESEMQDRIDQLSDQEYLLVAVIPSSNMTALDLDTVSEIDNCVLYVLQKTDPSTMTPDEILDQRSHLQWLMTEIKFMMLMLAGDTVNYNDFTLLMKKLTDGKIHTDPEYNYLGCTGWSISFDIKSNEFYPNQ